MLRILRPVACLSVRFFFEIAQTLSGHFLATPSHPGAWGPKLERVIHGPMPVSGETFDELSRSFIRTDIP